MRIIKIAFVGDIFPGGVLHYIPQACIDDEVSKFLKTCDVVVGNLECAIGEGYAFDEKKIGKYNNIIYAANEDIRRLVEIGVKVVSLANNHITDLGREGLINTLRLLDELDIKYFGAGMNKTQADDPAVLNIRGKTIAFLAFYDTTVAPHTATDDEWGVSTSDNLLERIKKAKSKYDYVFVIPHWGFEHIYRPLPRDVKLASRIIKAGADGIFGSHPHIIQPFKFKRKKPIFFSLGNFLFPDFYQQPPGPVWYPDKKIDLGNIPIAHKYMLNLNNHVLFVWPENSRAGMIVVAYLDSDILIDYRLTYLDKDNQVSFLSNSRKYYVILTLLGFFIKPFIYSCFFRLVEYFSFLKRGILEVENIIYKLFRKINNSRE